jgi:hypothetical protein
MAQDFFEPSLAVQRIKGRSSQMELRGLFPSSSQPMRVVSALILFLGVIYVFQVGIFFWDYVRASTMWNGA